MLASSAAYALLLHNDRPAPAILVIYHRNRPYRAVAGTIPATRLAVPRQTKFRIDPRRTDNLQGLGVLVERPYRPARTYLGAGIALRPAVAFFIAHHRLQQMLRVGPRPQNPVRTGAHAKLAGSAMTVETLPRTAARR